MRDPFLSKLLLEVEFLGAVGLLDKTGDVRCRDCENVVERLPGWQMRYECPCGWYCHD